MILFNVAVVMATLLAQAAPSMGAIETMPPEAAGDAILKGHEHGVIERVAPWPGPSMGPPGLLDYELIERADVAADSCTRRRWRVTFSYAPGSERATATPYRLDADTELALRIGDGCAAEFAGLYNGTTREQGLAALTFLDRLRTGAGRLIIKCVDRTRSGLCSTSMTIRRELAALRAWGIVPEGDGLELWLGTPGGVVTRVRHRPSAPRKASIERAIPPPA